MEKRSGRSWRRGGVSAREPRPRGRTRTRTRPRQPSPPPEAPGAGPGAGRVRAGPRHHRRSGVEALAPQSREAAPPHFPGCANAAQEFPQRRQHPLPISPLSSLEASRRTLGLLGAPTLVFDACSQGNFRHPSPKGAVQAAS